ncbi:urease accessory protein UreD [Echinimonas agarilytica]|uniref:Urease accessory protein UreD n=1 Tax=Echinimonas agarilytica TaxID=1215918 RepID=A0AA42B6W7_9GAMM|nr:urease accessory protein UreD [Echinimonas agarilytica]MCM2679165.1 urease accessory protein UreD [Echinimonas agarilytica]
MTKPQPSKLLSSNLEPALNPRHWPAHLALGFDRDGERTRMLDMTFKGPLRVQRPFYPEGGLCHVYLLHPPGGLVSGDDLHIQIDCSTNSEVMVTTPSAGKIYCSDSNDVVQQQRVDIQVEDASCEWLPMETIIFDGAHGKLTTQVNLYGDAKFIGLDIFCLGRPKSDLPFSQGSIEQRISVYHNDRPLMLERQLLTSNDALIHAQAGFNGQLVSGTLVVFGLSNPEQVIQLLREELGDCSNPHLSMTYRLNLVVIRYLGHCSEHAQKQLRKCWALLRPHLIHKPACPPRIWNT